MITNRSPRVRAMDHEHIQHREQQLEREARKRRGLRRRLILLAIVAVALSCMSVVTIYAQSVTLEEKKQEKIKLQAELDRLQEEEERLHQEINNYNDLEYIAEIARRDYYLTKPGETLFKLPEQPSH